MDLVKNVEGVLLQYKNWVRSNPVKLSDFESGVRYCSYLLASPFENSNLISEFIYSAYKLLVFFNDKIIYCGIIPPTVYNPYEDKLKKWLTIIDHCQVFIELSFQKAWGNRGKWFIICIIQILK